MLNFIAMIVLGSESSFGKFHSRAEFRHAIAKIDEGWTKKQVKDLLGKPDDILTFNAQKDDEIWCYGTNGHGTLPTLGIVPIDFGKVSFPLGFYSREVIPDVRVIREDEMRATMRKIEQQSMLNHERYSNTNECDPLGMIRVANSLAPLGKQKAVAVLTEYFWVDPYSRVYRDWLYWLVRVLFVPKSHQYVFPIPTLGSYFTSTPKDLRKWPNYPVALCKDIPITIYTGAEGDGSKPLFGLYLQEESKDWEIRTKKLTPPSDPFLAYSQIVNSGLMEFNRKEDRDVMREEILLLVRTAYKPNRKPHIGDDDAKDFEKCHQEFLRLGCRWDSKLDLYVRKDGSYDKSTLK